VGNDAPIDKPSLESLTPRPKTPFKTIALDIDEPGQHGRRPRDDTALPSLARSEQPFPVRRVVFSLIRFAEVLLREHLQHCRIRAGGLAARPDVGPRFHRRIGAPEAEAWLASSDAARGVEGVPAPSASSGWGVPTRDIDSGTVFLGAVLAAGAAVALPAVAVAGVARSHPDAELFALAERCEAAAKRADVAGDAYAVAEFASPHIEAEEAEALRLQGIALDELEDLAMQVVWMRALTVDGLLAKARAMKKVAFPGDGAIVERIETGLKTDGPWDADPVALALARDLLALAGEDAR